MKAFSTMKRGFVFSLLSTFSDEEVAAFDLFLQSPYYTKGTNQDKSRVIAARDRASIQRCSRARHFVRTRFPGYAFCSR
jgi:hypothetical protein